MALASMLSTTVFSDYEFDYSRYLIYVESNSICLHLLYIRMHFFKVNLGTSLIAQSVKNLSAMPETWVRFLGQEDALEN